MVLRRVLGVLLGALLTLVTLSPPATAVVTIQLSGTITNTDGIPQNGTVCLQLVGSGSCGGNHFTDGTWSSTWNDVDDAPGDYLVRVISSTMDGTSRWYVSGNTAGTTDQALATPVHLAPGEPDFAFTMVMPAIAKLTGRVTDTGGIGVPGLVIHHVHQTGASRQVVSGALGAYDFGYMRAGPGVVSTHGGDTYAGAQTARGRTSVRGAGRRRPRRAARCQHLGSGDRLGHRRTAPVRRGRGVHGDPSRAATSAATSRTSTV